MRLQGGRMKSVTTAGRCARAVIACGLLLTAAGCGDSTPVGVAGRATGVLQVSVSTTGADLPAAGYYVSVDSGPGQAVTDRKSTRLNSSHGYISYAVFCLKKKKKIQDTDNTDLLSVLNSSIAILG